MMETKETKQKRKKEETTKTKTDSRLFALKISL